MKDRIHLLILILTSIGAEAGTIEFLGLNNGDTV